MNINLISARTILAATTLCAAALSLSTWLTNVAEATTKGSLSIAMRVSPSQPQVNLGETISALVRFSDRSVGCVVTVKGISLNSMPLPLFQISSPALDTSKERVTEAIFQLQATDAGAAVLRAVVSAEHNCTGAIEAIDFDADSITVNVSAPEPVRPVGAVSYTHL
ncbi:MAG: hypothetical protein KIH69_007090, partial [Anaerolineae bacterium]|nr:hypothetical protein [Anaerolineae bacterium]